MIFLKTKTNTDGLDIYKKQHCFIQLAIFFFFFVSGLNLLLFMVTITFYDPNCILVTPAALRNNNYY